MAKVGIRTIHDAEVWEGGNGNAEICRCAIGPDIIKRDATCAVDIDGVHELGCFEACC